MPRNVRNFWIEADIDGRSTTLEGGPRSRDGGISVTLYIRERGEVSDAVTVHGSPSADGRALILNVSPAPSMAGGVQLQPDGYGFTITTER